MRAKNSSKEGLIHIADGYYYAIEDNQYTLYFCGERDKIDIVTKKSTGERIEYKECVGYYFTLENMLRSVIKEWSNEKAKSFEVTTIKEHLDVLQDTRDKVLEITKGF